ncbi:MAG TPA: hemolysin family protein [Thermoanaerobaculia bacterium]|nr:hemolysin family protein [Thermoanaerobaculia bacterium]
MGSSLTPGQWRLLGVAFGLLVLLFDAARYFAYQLGPMRLRRWGNGDSRTEMNSERSTRWSAYDPDHFALTSGALLEIYLGCAVAFTALSLQDHGIVRGTLFSLLLWSVLLIAWKFLLLVVPEELGESILKAFLPVFRTFYLLSWPLLFPLNWTLSMVTTKREIEEEEEEVTDEELQAYIDVGEQEGILEEGDAKLVQSIVDFGDAIVKEIMTPRIDMQAFDVNGSVESLAELFSESKYSRIPVYENNVDRIVGIIHIKDIYDVVLRRETKTVRDLARPPYIVSVTKKVSDLLREFQIEHEQIAVVVDEYGGTAGIVTIEDLLEEIVGEISDEHEDDEQSIVPIDDTSYVVNGVTKVQTIEELLDTKIEGEGYETVAGLIFAETGRVPKVGETVRKGGLIFEVDRADRRRIYRVKITRDPDWRPESDEERT